jgi:hypothetical protein
MKNINLDENHDETRKRVRGIKPNNKRNKYIINQCKWRGGRLKMMVYHYMVVEEKNEKRATKVKKKRSSKQEVLEIPVPLVWRSEWSVVMVLTSPSLIYGS